MIEKSDITYLAKEHIPFTVLPNHVLQKINSTDALAIYCYLASLPNDWIINKQHLMNHFDMGRDKINKAINLLKDKNLIEFTQEKNSDGTYKKSELRLKRGYEVIHSQPLTENPSPVNSPLTEKPVSGQPVTGKTATTNTIINTNTIKEQRESAPKNQRAPLSPDFVPNDQVIEVAKRTSSRTGLSVEDLITKFKNLYAKNSTRKEADWNAVFENFLISEKPLSNNVVKFNNKGESRCTVPDFVSQKEDRTRQEYNEIGKKHMQDIFDKMPFLKSNRQKPIDSIAS